MFAETPKDVEFQLKRGEGYWYQIQSRVRRKLNAVYATYLPKSNSFAIRYLDKYRDTGAPVIIKNLSTEVLGPFPYFMVRGERTHPDDFKKIK